MFFKNYNIVVLESQKAYECLHLEISILFNSFLLNLEKWIEDMKIMRKEACRLQNLKMLEYLFQKEFFPPFLVTILFYFKFSRSKKEISKCAETLFLTRDDGKIAFSILSSKANLISDLLSQWKIVVPFSTNFLKEQFSKMGEIILILGRFIFIRIRN